MTNAIVLENERTDGVMPESYWNVASTSQIEGFTTDISVNAGTTVDFKINVNGDAGSDYRVEIFRLGYYGGDGARKVAEWVNTSATVQPNAEYDASRALVDAGNWSVTDSWTTPEDATAGVYIARLQRLDADGNPIEGAVNQIPFVVREDDRAADIVLQTSDTTWQAYNGWFGNNGQVGANFYGDASGTVDHPDIPGENGAVANRAYALSYNRPFITAGVDGVQGGPSSGAQDYLFGADYAAIYWLEKNGYDVSYISGVDTDRQGADYLTKYKSYISVGHDEYWSGGQRANIEEARDAGVNLLFWSGNEVYWKTRYESSIVDGVEYRTLVCYKETWAVADPAAGPEDYPNLDPSDIWTGTWRDTRFLDNPLAGGDGVTHEGVTGLCPTCNCAENALTGQLFGPDGTGEFGGALDVPGDMAQLRIWRDTSVADNGGAVDIAPGLIGYEWDTAPNDANRPAGLILLSQTTLPWSGILTDQGNTTAPGTATHSLSLYRDDSGALVFGAGTTFWSWGLSDKHASAPYGATIANATLQQFTVNLFADMGIQPGVADAILASQGLVRAIASLDSAAAVAQINDLPATLSALQAVTISGTATDNDGNAATQDGVVALVEVSLDAGKTWHTATGTTNWSYTWIPVTEGTYSILVRAIDDSLNLPKVSALYGDTVTITAPVPPAEISLFDPFVAYSGQSYTTSSALELGTMFTPNRPGVVTELHYYRDASDATDTDIRAGHLWDADGTLLATVQFTSVAGQSGWQTAVLATPFTLIAGHSYVVSYTTSDNYVAAQGFFASSFMEPFGVLVAGASSGVYATAAGAFPTSSYNASNYWVDLSFSATTTTNAAPVITSQAAFTLDENTLFAGRTTATDADGDPITYSITGGADAALFGIDAATGALFLKLPADHEAPADANGDNIFQLIVSATDSLGAATRQTIAVTLADVADETGKAALLYDASDLPALTVTSDATDYELGTRFQASSNGQILDLRYYRGAADANDTDVRTLNLWKDDGTLLGSVTVTSGVGQSGWQTGALSAPISVVAGQNYIVSYGTTQNYVATNNYFTTSHASDDGRLLAPASTGGAANGVFTAGGTGIFPAATYLSTNYWTDVVFVPSLPAANAAPEFTLASSNVTVLENQTLALDLSAFDAEGDTLVFGIAGGDDAARFSINAQTGLLTFRTAPDFETPADVGANNSYEITVSVSDGIAPAVTRSLVVAVADVANEPTAGASSLFGATDLPAAIITYDPTDYELGLKFVTDQAGQVTSLRYYRGAEDALDTDIRTLNLWDASGNRLATVTVQSDPGQTGWQTGTLSAPVTLAAGQSYVVSYGTTQNYAFSGGFFSSAWTSADTHLVAASGANGIFHSGETGIFPTETYNASNYWVDLIVEPLDPLAIV